MELFQVSIETSKLIADLQQYLRRKYNYDELFIKDWRKITEGWETDIFILKFSPKSELKLHKIPKSMVIRLFSGKFGGYKVKEETKTLQLMMKANYPVPKVYFSEENSEVLGKAFILMEEIEGKFLETFIISKSEAEREKSIKHFAKLFVQLHNVDWKKLVPNPTYYTENSKQLSLDKLQELADYAESHKIPEVNEILDWIFEKVKSVELNQLACIHKDFHPGNIIVSEKDKKSYVIDWHEFQIMDYRVDLAWTSMLLQCHWSKSIHDKTLHYYEKISGSKTQNFEFFEVIALYIRIVEMSISLKSSATDIGMKDSTKERLMKLEAPFKELFNMLYDRTKIKLPQIEILMLGGLKDLIFYILFGLPPTKNPTTIF